MSCVRDIFIYVTSVNFVLKIAEAGSRVALAGGASFVKINGKDCQWEVGQSIRARSTNVKSRDIRTSRVYALPTSGPNLFR